MGAAKPVRIQTVIATVLRRAETQQKLLALVQQRWAQVVGRELARHSRPVSLRRGRLVVHVEQPGDGFALSYRREDVLARVKAISAGRAQELVIRPGELGMRRVERKGH